MVRLQSVLLSPTSQRQFWSRDPPRTQTSQAFSYCFWFCLLLSLSSGVCVLNHMNSHSLNCKVEVRDLGPFTETESMEANPDSAVPT